MMISGFYWYTAELRYDVPGFSTPVIVGTLISRFLKLNPKDPDARAWTNG